MAALRRGHAGGGGVVGMTGPVEDYLRQLRASLRTRPEETIRILAEAEDHLRESVAAGQAAGLTETEAAEAAISRFGTVRAVAARTRTRAARHPTPSPAWSWQSGCWPEPCWRGVSLSAW